MLLTITLSLYCCQLLWYATIEVQRKENRVATRFNSSSKIRSDDPKVQQARQRAGRIVNAMNELATLVTQAWEAKDHHTLGYDTWQSYTIGEFGHGDTAIKARQVIVAMLRGTGLSQRAIAAQTGTSVATVNNDLADLSAEPPEGDPATVNRYSTVQPPEQSPRVTGLDGRTQPATRGGMTGDERRARERARRGARNDALRETAAEANRHRQAVEAARHAILPPRFSQDQTPPPPVPDMIHGHTVYEAENCRDCRADLMNRIVARTEPRTRGATLPLTPAEIEENHRYAGRSAAEIAAGIVTTTPIVDYLNPETATALGLTTPQQDPVPDDDVIYEIVADDTDTPASGYAPASEAAREELTQQAEARILLAANFHARFRQWLATLNGDQLTQLEADWENIMDTALNAITSRLAAQEREAAN